MRGLLRALRRGILKVILEAFAVLYREFADALTAWKRGKGILPATLPGIRAGVRGMRFMERAMESNRKEGWVNF